MCKEQRKAEEVIRQREETEELRQLRNLKYNLETGIVREMSSELIKIMMEKNWREL